MGLSEARSIVLAIRFKTPIYVDEHRISMVGQKLISDREFEEFREKLGDIKPDDFAF